ncbi:MAG: phosphoglycerate mutase family protein, partial [Pseudomonadota bacterium]|nr:phosphoglycerate mutase family protein [Pseudomonadota bacterium]
MSTHPQTGSLYFVRHAPVVKRTGHVPPADPPIMDGPFNLAPLCKQLPENAIWHVSPLQRTVETAELMKQDLKPARVSPAAELVEMDHGSWHDRPVAEVWNEIKDGPLHNWTFL